MTRPDEMYIPDELDDVLEQLACLTPGEGEGPRPVAQSLAELRKQLAVAEPSLTENWIWRFKQMFRKKYALSALVLIALLAVAFALPPVRAAASDFLGLFRVQKFAAISVSPQQVALLEQIADQGLHPGELQMVEEPGRPQPVGSVAEAEELVGRNVVQPADLGVPERIAVTSAGHGQLTVDLQSARQIMEMVEVDPSLLPDSLDGAEISVRTYPGVEMAWNGGLMLLQTESPEVDYPENVDAVLLGEGLLQVLGMTPGEARRLAREIDWTGTLLLPIPQDLATFSEVRVNGGSGLALTSVDGHGNSLMWQESGVIYMLVGDRQVDELLQTAGSLR